MQITRTRISQSKQRAEKSPTMDWTATVSVPSNRTSTSNSRLHWTGRKRVTGPNFRSDPTFFFFFFSCAAVSNPVLVGCRWALQVL